MKSHLNPARDIAKSLQLLTAAKAGDLTRVTFLVENMGAETGLRQKDIDYDNIKFADVVPLEMFKMAHLMEDHHILNAPLYWAAFCGHQAVANYFLDRGDYCQQSLDVALFAAVRSGSVPLLHKILALGGNPAFEDYASFDQSLTIKKNPITDILLEHLKNHDYAIGALTKAGDFNKVIDLLDKNPDPRKAIVQTIHGTSDRAAWWEEDRMGDCINHFDMLLAYAEARGDHMGDIITLAMSHAVDQWSSLMIMHIAQLPQFATHPDKERLLNDGMIRIVRQSNPGLDMPGHDFDSMAQQLVEQGASAQIMLREAVSGVLPNAAKVALHAGADPRADHKNFLSPDHRKPETERTPRESTLHTLLQNSIAKLDMEDTERFNVLVGNDKPSIAQMRTVDAETGRTGLMLSLTAGKLRAALAAFGTATDALTFDDITHEDHRGGTLLKRLRHLDMTHVLFDQNIWAGKDTAYAAFYAQLPSDLKEAHAALHNDLSNSLNAEKNRQKIYNSVPKTQKRWRL